MKVALTEVTLKISAKKPSQNTIIIYEKDPKEISDLFNMVLKVSSLVRLDLLLLLQIQSESMVSFQESLMKILQVTTSLTGVQKQVLSSPSKYL